MNNTKIELSKLDQDYDSYVLTDNDKNRIKPIKDILRSQGISFKYFITISPYNFIPDNLKKEQQINAPEIIYIIKQLALINADKSWSKRDASKK